MKQFTFFSKNLLLSLILLLVHSVCSLKAQDNVGIGTSAPAASALLDIDASLGGNSKGLLIPRLSDAEMHAIPLPANSLLVYNVDSMCYYFYRQSPNTWVSMCDPSFDASQDTMYINYSVIDSLFANYLHVDSLFAQYVNIDSLFAQYIQTDSLFAQYVNIDSLFAHYIHTDSLFSQYINVDSLFAHYISTDSLFVQYATIDSLFAHFISTDSLFAHFGNIDSLIAAHINVDSLFAHYSLIDSLIAHYISTDSIFAQYANLDSLFANYLNVNHIDVDSIFGTFASFDSLVINGLSIQSIITNILNTNNSNNFCGGATINYVAKFTSPTTVCNSIIYDTGARIGIGTTAPDSKLHVENPSGGCAITVSSPPNTQAAVDLVSSTTGQGFSLRKAGAGGNDHDFRIFNTNLGTAIHVNYTNNRVGIGMVSPGQALEVNGKIEVSSKGIQPGGGPWLAPSDQRLKKNITPFNDGLAKLLQINPVTFQYNGTAGLSSEETHVGIVAQEIQKILPYTVTEESMSIDPNDSASVENRLVFDGNAVTYVLINSIKEQQIIIDGQQGQINNLQSENQTLKSEISALKSTYDERLKALEALLKPKDGNMGTESGK